MNFLTPGYETMELSTQCVIAEALKRGLAVKILDEEAQFIALSNQTKTEYIQQATKTSLDSYVTSLILGNKWVTKNLLAEAGLSVPTGQLVRNRNDALADHERYRQGRWAIKPKTTNYGIGITLVENPSLETYTHAVDLALREDTTLLVEQFVEGPEYRFLVIAGKTVAVLERIPANVRGDGTHSIKTLVELKNQDPRRGVGHKTPLEKIQLGPVEIAMLKQQGLSPDSIPEENTQVFLRTNSNISTGGDSVDRTDSVHPSYKTIAERATQTVHATVCGVDIILNHPEQPATPNNHAILELNYNPVLYFHHFPAEGTPRNVSAPLLDALGF